VRRDRTDAILEAAAELAMEGGFENVRQREVAARAKVALGTLYKRFRSKEELLTAVLAQRAARLEARVEATPPRGDSVQARLSDLFAVMTRELCEHPRYARAVIRAMSSGVPELAGRITAFQGRIALLVIGVVRDRNAAPSPQEFTLILMLLQLWFANLVGWSAGLFDLATLDRQMAQSVDVVTRGLGFGTAASGT
jgi:AcrR family transcriptional regulator